MTILKMITLKLFNVIILFFLPEFTSENFIVYEVTAFNPHERELLYSLHITNTSNIFMNGVSNEAALPMKVIVETNAAQAFEDKLNAYGIQYQSVSFISERQIKYPKVFTSTVNISKDFYNWENILAWINTQEKSGIFKKTVIAKTFERRDIFFLKLSEGKIKPIVFILGGEDALDWMSSAVILNLLEEFLEKSDLSTLLNIFDFYLLPILNPDGFVYTKKQDRLWVKNRREIFPRRTCADNNSAVGVNIARNWFLQKSYKLVDGVCNSVYIGSKALSEEETKSLSYILNSLAQNMIAFINIRGFGRFITVPYEHMNMYSNINYDIVMEILKSTSYKVHEKHNVSRYYVTATSSIFYNFSGNIADWVKFKLNIPIVYTIYLEKIETVLPLPQHIELLKKEFFTILNESMLLANDIYGPLFNNQRIITFITSFPVNTMYLLFYILFK